jgi:hypothetical protein
MPVSGASPKSPQTCIWQGRGIGDAGIAVGCWANAAGVACDIVRMVKSEMNRAKEQNKAQKILSKLRRMIRFLCLKHKNPPIAAWCEKVFVINCM